MKYQAKLFSIVLSFFVLSACTMPRSQFPAYGNTPVAHRSTAAAVTPEVLRDWFDQARKIVENDRGIDLSNISLSLLREREMLFALSDLYGKKASPSMTFDTRIKLFSGSAFLAANHTQAVYDPYNKRIIINNNILSARIRKMKNRGVSASQTTKAVLIHELTHAADDRQFNLLAIEQDRVGDKLGLYFVAEGSAESHTKRLCIIAGCDEAVFEEENMTYQRFDNQNELLSIVGPLMKRNTLIYEQGYRFINSLNMRDPTGALVDAAMKYPPGDIFDFYTPDQYPNKARAKRRDSIFNLLQGLDFDQDEYSLKIPQMAFDIADLPLGIRAQRQHIKEYGKKILASGAMIYINQQAMDHKQLKISIYQGANTQTLLEQKQDILDKHQAHINMLKHAAVGVNYPAPAIVEEWSKGVPSNTQRYVVQLTETGSGESVTLFSSLLIEGNYLIFITTFDDNNLNKLALAKTVKAIKSM